MPRFPIAALTLLLITRFASAGGDQVFSGPQPGEKLTQFKALGLSGAQAGKEHEILAQPKNDPALLVFIHEVTRPAFQLLRPLDFYAATLQQEGLATHLIWLTADKTATEMYLNNARKSLGLRSSIGISLDGVEGPGNYGLNRKVTLTVLVARGNKVVANFALVQPNETDAPKVLNAVAKLMGKKAPTLDEIRLAMGPIVSDQKQPPKPKVGDLTKTVELLAAELQRLQVQVSELTVALNDARAKLAKLEGQPVPPPLGAKKGRPGKDKAKSDKAKSDKAKSDKAKSSPSPELQQLMRRMIQKDNDEAAIRRIAEEMLRWAGDNAARRAEMADYCRLIANQGYGTEAAQKALKRLAGGE